jgi:hypothetical protein
MKVLSTNTGDKRMQNWPENTNTKLRVLLSLKSGKDLSPHTEITA